MPVRFRLLPEPRATAPLATSCGAAVSKAAMLRVPPPAPKERLAMESVNPAMLSVAAVLAPPMVSAEALGMALLMPTARVPALSAVGPE